jgi:DNA-binding MarR family transcriptional regulator
MNETSEPLSDRVFHRFLTLLRRTRQHSRQMSEEHGIRPRQYAVLRFLRESGPATVGQVGAYLHTSPSTTSTLLAGLEEMGYLTRTRSQDDNRVVIVELTTVGRDIVENTPPGRYCLLRQRLGLLSQDRLVQINDVLNEIMGSMEFTGDK